MRLLVLGHEVPLIRFLVQGVLRRLLEDEIHNLRLVDLGPLLE
jgi:hypothetical protein